MQQKSIIFKVNNFLNKYNLLKKTFVLGFSGGYDSMCLLDILSKQDIKLIAAHYNHGWRGKEADQEEQRCKDFCEKRGITFYSQKAPSNLKKTETAAREARYFFFNEVLKKYNANGIFTAHNNDDNAETVAYRIIKGTGIKGLEGIQEIRGNIYRPLLDCTRKEIEEYCEINNLTPNVDSSNTNTIYKRNFIRYEILPKLEKINPSVKKSINNLSKLAKLDNQIITEYLSNILPSVITENTIDIVKFISLSDAIQQKIIYSLISNYLDEYDLKKVTEILEFIKQNNQSKEEKRKSLTKGLWLYVNNRNATIYKENNSTKNISIEITKCGEYEFGEYKIEVTETTEKPDKFPNDNSGIAYVDLFGYEFSLTLRYGRSRDIFQPLGMSGKMFLKKYLSGKSIEQHKRNKIIVLAQSNEILWIPYLGISENVRTQTNPTHKLKITKTT